MNRSLIDLQNKILKEIHNGIEIVEILINQYESNYGCQLSYELTKSNNDYYIIIELERL